MLVGGSDLSYYYVLLLAWLLCGVAPGWRWWWGGVLGGVVVLGSSSCLLRAGRPARAGPCVVTNYPTTHQPPQEQAR